MNSSNDMVCNVQMIADALNRECFCINVDVDSLQSTLQQAMLATGQPADIASTHPHLFSRQPYFVSRRHLAQIEALVAAVEEVIRLPAYREAVMAWAPEIARFEPGADGGMLGLDVHLGAEGPQLIEINTNPGGALLNTLMARTLRVCLPDQLVAPIDPARSEQAILQSFLDDWRAQRGDTSLRSIAIVDENPATQYLYPEFLLYRKLFRDTGLIAGICAPQDLDLDDGKLRLSGVDIDLVYNRLTDFALEQPGHAPLRDAYLSDAAVFSPHPRAHALLADKRNLALLCNAAFLHDAGASTAAIEVLASSVPNTQTVTPQNADALWSGRRQLFFKPAAGFGSRASYRGDKLTRRVWNDILAAPYVAQSLVPPSVRHVAADAVPLKVDVRCYFYQGAAISYAARMYQGQTTNFRTEGGGFAPLLTSAT